MKRILFILLVCFCSSLRAEYKWTGTEWQWVEPDRQPAAPPTLTQQGSGGGANFDDDYDDEDTYPYDNDKDDDDDDDYDVNYDKKVKKPQGGKGVTVSSKGFGGKGGGDGKATGIGKPERGGQQQAPSRGMGAFMQTDDEDLVDGSGEDPDPYWSQNGSGDGAYNGARDPLITESSPDIDLDLEDNGGRKTAPPPESAAGGGGSKTWNFDSTWAGATTPDSRSRTPAPPVGGGAGNDDYPVDQYDEDDDDDEDEEDNDDYSDKSVDIYDDGLPGSRNNDDISIDDVTSSSSSTSTTTASPPAWLPGGSPATTPTTIIRTSPAPSVTTITTTADGGAAVFGGGSDTKDTPIISDMLPNNRPVSFFAQPGILAAVIGGAVVGLLCAILLVMFIVYRMRKKDEGSYILDEPAKRTLNGNSYAKTPNKEFYA